MSESTKGFYFLESYEDAINDLDPADQLALYKAISRYALYGEEPELTGIARTIWKLIRPNLDASRKRQEDGAKGGRPRKDAGQNEPGSQEQAADPRVDAEEKPEKCGFSGVKTMVSESKKPNMNMNMTRDHEEENDGSSAPARETTSTTIRPTVEEVERYCSQSGIRGVDAARFVAYNDGRGWKIGDKAAEDWTALLRLWIAREGERRGRSTPRRSPTGTFGAFEQRQYDADDLETMLLTAGRPT